MCQHKSFGFALHAVFKANITQTEQKSSIDKMKKFICVAVNIFF